ncbi:O-methyltransferase [Mycena filopes]|nr:O-methyltransferase [Mycena filopes]
MDSISTLRRLSNIITDAVNTIEDVYTAAQMPLPSLGRPFNENDPAETLQEQGEVADAIKNIIAAAAQISATLCDPSRFAVNTAHAFLLSSCLLAASEFNVVEILCEAGPKELHVHPTFQGADATEIAALSNTDPGLMSRMLRLLATHHIFREVSPGVFSNNRVSSTLNKGKPSSVLFNKREERLIGARGIAAFVEHTADIGGKSGGYLVESMVNAANAKPQIPFNIVYNTKESLWSWMQWPQNRYNVSRFTLGITATAEPLEMIFQAGFDWGSLPHGSKITDVGGGLGRSSLSIAKRYPHLRVTVQDLGEAIKLSKEYWRENFSEHINKQMVEFQVHDFFSPQAVTDASVFLLRYILHDWPDEKCSVILGHLRAAAHPTTRLVIVEQILRSAAHSGSAGDIPGASRPTAEAPLLPNWGVASANSYLNDLIMHVLLGGVERTLDGFVQVLRQSGWNLVEVHHCAGSQLSQLVATPL